MTQKIKDELLRVKNKTENYNSDKDYIFHIELVKSNF